MNWKFLIKPKVRIVSDDERQMKTRPSVPGGEVHPSEIGEKKPGGKTFFGIRLVWPFILFVLVGCANYNNTKYTRTMTDGSSVSIEMPKELKARDFELIFEPSGAVHIKASEYSSENQGTLSEGTQHDKVVIQELGTQFKELIESGAKSTAKGAVGIP